MLEVGQRVRVLRNDRFIAKNYMTNQVGFIDLINLNVDLPYHVFSKRTSGWFRESELELVPSEGGQ